MHSIKLARLIPIVAFLFAQSTGPLRAQDSSSDEASVVKKVDSVRDQIAKNVADLQTVVVIDHSRLAKKAGVPMPPSIVTIFSDSSVNTPLMQVNPRLGLDLPYKVLAYAEPGKGSPSVGFITGEFLAKRHGLAGEADLAPFSAGMKKALDGIPSSLLSPVKTGTLTRDFGIVEMTSDFSFEETIERIKKAVLSQGDTVWFGEIDYQSEAASLDAEIPPATLLLFGGPGPGGMAMAKYPKLGLDAFCQKLLVYVDSQGAVKVIFNDIVAFAELHYGSSNKPQNVINGRLIQTFTAAVKRPE